MTSPSSASDSARTGLLLGLAAFLGWGLSPLFWKLVTHVPPHALLAQRILWSAPVFVVAAWVFGQGPAIATALATPRQRGWMLVSGVFVATNWLLFLVAVATDRVLHASLGYFLNPLVSTLLGALVLREGLRAGQWAAVVCAGLGVLWLSTQLGDVPWIGLGLAGSFGLYGLVRKQAPVPALAGSAVEILFLLPLALIGVGADVAQRGLPDLGTGGLLVCTGIVTAVPLLLFSASVRRIPLSTVGVLQYVAPSGQLALAVLVFGEPFLPRVHVPAFALIWTGVAIYALQSVLPLSPRAAEASDG